MTEAFDNRLISVGIQLIGANGQPEGAALSYDQSLYILATGTQFTDGNIGECALRIDNIDKKTRDYLVQKTSPWAILPAQRLYANITLDVGRKSSGTFRLFEGQASAANPSQPPDIGLTFTALTMSALLGNIGTLSAGPNVDFKSLCQQIAAQFPNPTTGMPGIPLNYQVTKTYTVSNYSFNGALINQVHKLNTLAPVNATVSNNVLVVVDAGQPLDEAPVMVSSATGMIGVPEVNELGVKVKVLIGATPQIKPLSKIKIQSSLNPAANGTWVVYKLGFEVASRDTPFYWICDCRQYLLGAS